jgi:hypothetical protein
MRKVLIPVAVVAFLFSGSAAFAQQRQGSTPSDVGPSLGSSTMKLLEPAKESCGRWLYNPSGYTWKLIPPPNLQEAMCGQSGSCLARPYAGAAIHYPSHIGDSKFRLQGFIADSNDPAKPKTIVFDHEIGVGDEEAKGVQKVNPTAHLCATMYGVGGQPAPAGVTLNEPSQGDITVCGSGFDGAAAAWNPNYVKVKCNFSVHEPTMDEVSNEGRKTPGTGMMICADRTKIDTMTWDKTHCADHGGVCRTGCDH